MKIRIIINSDQEPHVYDVPINEVNSYIDLLTSHNLVNEHGELFEVDTVLFDIYQNAMDVSCVEVK